MTINRILFLVLALSCLVLPNECTTQRMRSRATKNGQVHGAIYPIEQKYAVAEAHTILLVNDFVYLSCNSALDDQPCPSWTSVFGSSATVFSERVIIECGTCITMDQRDVTLEQGVDVRGKLVFPEGFAGTVRTASLTVQGELEVYSTGPVNGTPMIHILMIGSQAQSFTPIEENSSNCGGGNCDVGHKAITVAGGKVSSKYMQPINCTGCSRSAIIHILSRLFSLI